MEEQQQQEQLIMPTVGRIVQVVANGGVFNSLVEQQEMYAAIVTQLRDPDSPAVSRQSDIKVSMFTGEVRLPVLVCWLCHKSEAGPDEPYWDWLYTGQATNTINQYAIPGYLYHQPVSSTPNEVPAT